MTVAAAASAAPFTSASRGSSSGGAVPESAGASRSSSPTAFSAALEALALIARFHQVGADPAALLHRLGKAASEPLTPSDLLLGARELGLKAKLVRSSTERLTLVPLPALALMSDGRVLLLAQCDGRRVLFMDPSRPSAGGRPAIESVDAFDGQWTGQLILVASRASIAGDLARFDFSWFIPSLVKYRRLFGEVLLVSLFLQLFALVSPLFFQVVMDKVLVHRGLATLDVLVVGLVVVVLFESLLTVLRSYLFARDYGSDVIEDHDTAFGNTDVLQFLQGVERDQLWFRQTGHALEVSIVGTADQIVVRDWYVARADRVEEFRLADGSTLLESRVQGLVDAMAAFAPPAAGATVLPPNMQQVLAPTLAASWGP
ncbi:cysteine peptidase family C39 domain-containing protein [Piscinibacter koreensis]|uniref:Uncharacterized protein n=1 Tax=Piscinibacter koreensis TaxID=2742824 RepID=A0A7Y6NN12_9BURK|nr:hypothetical protein [Schlegelella koreensis]